MSDAQLVPWDGCWNDIGVHGDGSCALIETVVHCRNCRHFASAAARILDRTPAETDTSTAAAIAAPRLMVERGARAFVFRIGREWLALPLTAVVEVMPSLRVHRLPHRSAAVAGVVPCGGELVIAIALDKLLSIESDGKAPTRMVVAARGADRFVFPASEVAGETQLGDLKKLPATVKQSPRHSAHAVTSWNRRTVTLLDAERLFQTCSERLS